MADNRPEPPLGYGRNWRNNGLGMLGYQVRSTLYPGEEQFFRENPNVAGMAAETNDVILNPYASSDVNREAVARNEAFRLHLRNIGLTPSFPTTAQQRAQFVNTPYEGNEGAIRETIAARLYSGDPSAYATPEQHQWLSQFLHGMPYR